MTFKSLVCALALFLLPLMTKAQLQTRMLQVEADRAFGVNTRLLEFQKDLKSVAKIKGLIPLMDKYVVGKDNADYLKDLFQKNADVDTPKVYYKDKVVVFHWEKTKRKVEFEVDTRKGTLSFKNKTLDFTNESLESLSNKIYQLKLFTEAGSGVFIEDANALFGAALLITGLISLVVDVAVSTISSDKCRERFWVTQRSFQEKYVSCVNDTRNVFENPRSKIHSDTYGFLQDVKNQMVGMTPDNHWQCKKTVEDEFFYWDFFSTQSCLDSNATETMCKTMGSLEKCLKYFEKLDPRRVSQKRGIKNVEIIQYIDTFQGTHNGSGVSR